MSDGSSRLASLLTLAAGLAAFVWWDNRPAAETDAVVPEIETGRSQGDGATLRPRSVVTLPRSPTGITSDTTVAQTDTLPVAPIGPDAPVAPVKRTPPSTPPTPVEALPPAAVNPLAVLKREQFNQTISRPLFSATRKPPPVKPPPPKVAAKPKPRPERVPALVKKPLKPKPRRPDANLVLTGIVTSDDIAVALVHDKKSGQNVRLFEGDAVAGWQVGRIDRNDIVLVQKQWRMQLSLFKK